MSPNRTLGLRWRLDPTVVVVVVVVSEEARTRGVLGPPTTTPFSWFSGGCVSGIWIEIKTLSFFNLKKERKRERKKYLIFDPHHHSLNKFLSFFL